MRRILASVAALALIAGTASAERILKRDNMDDEWKWVDTETQTEGRVMMSDTGQRPDDCPDGAYFIGQDPQTGSKRVIMRCDSDEVFGLVNPKKSGQMTTSGDPYPDGTYLLVESDRTDEWNVLTDEELN